MEKSKKRSVPCPHCKALFDKLKAKSGIDHLTGLPNRQVFDKVVRREIKRTTRGVVSLSLAILDLDDFKQVNDTYGHPVGDRVLKKLASILKKETRSTDIVCRIGGEEFVIIMPETPLQGARSHLEEIRIIIEKKMRFKEGKTRFSVTTSVGVTTISQKPDISSQSSLYVRADKALYLAKKNGKNRVYALS